MKKVLDFLGNWIFAVLAAVCIGIFWIFAGIISIVGSFIFAIVYAVDNSKFKHNETVIDAEDNIENPDTEIVQ